MLKIIKKLCKEKEISIYQLEESLGFGHNTIYQWNKRTPRIDKINSVADYFQVSTDYLLGRSNIPNKSSVHSFTSSINNDAIELINDISKLDKKSLLVIKNMVNRILELEKKTNF
ncbi:helix-turn-helix domain-containing protein [Enterococcus faecalis]|uniref:helix-turn-helix domain-containing protein n=1 Tax=Enterococcus faecalis TaxID=1351 RepID=UPI002DBD442F|nr:helix-turn-helix domain-containing protein [Enterococcus faecalis]MEB7427754.1 helix-turn-helix domain-containing protein [Enterococcus faecalis]